MLKLLEELKRRLTDTILVVSGLKSATVSISTRIDALESRLAELQQVLASSQTTQVDEPVMDFTELDQALSGLGN